MEITKREILFCTIIIAIMTGLGIWISNPIISNATQNAEKVVAATHVADSMKFGYIERTDVGDFIAEGSLNTVDPVSITDIDGQWGLIIKLTQEYELHTRTVTTVDSKGVAHTHVETYWEWDTKKTEKWAATTVNFLGKDFSPKDIGFKYHATHYKTINAPKKLFHDDVRYVYNTAPTTYYGTLSGISEGKQFTNLQFKKDNTIQKSMDSAISEIKDAPIVFWMLWGLLSVGFAILFCYFDNKWLY